MDCPNSLQREIELIRLAQRGDAASFGILVQSHQSFAYNIALRMLTSPEEALDVTQEAFLRAWQALPRFRAEAQFSTWLYRIVMNLCYNRMPRLKRDASQMDLEDCADITPAGFPLPSSKVEEHERQALLQAEISKLPPIYQVILQLRYTQDLSYEEIAQIMDIPIGTVKTRLHRAHQQLCTALNRQKEWLEWTA